MHKKGFSNMVKGLLAWFIRVFRSSGPSPSTLSTSSTNVENNHNEQHNEAKNCSKNVSWTFLGYLWSYKEWPGCFNWGWISRYCWTFQYDGIWGLMDLQEVYKNIIFRNEQRHPFDNAWFYKLLGVGFTGFGVQMIFLWICKAGNIWRNGSIVYVAQNVLGKMFIN